MQEKFIKYVTCVGGKSKSFFLLGMD